MKHDHKARTLEQRLAARTHIDPLSGCHLWEGPCNRNGYPMMTMNGRRQLLHRLVWTLRYGPIPDGMELCHRCDEPRCINPDHHFVGTHQLNMADRRIKRQARIERARADLERAPGPADLAGRHELTPMRMYVRGVEITGKVLIRPFDAGAAPPPRKRAVR